MTADFLVRSSDDTDLKKRIDNKKHGSILEAGDYNHAFSRRASPDLVKQTPADGSAITDSSRLRSRNPHLAKWCREMPDLCLPAGDVSHHVDNRM